MRRYAMHVLSFVSYLCRSSQNPHDRAAFKFIRTIKANDSGSCWSLDTTNLAEAIDWFGELAALVLAMKNLPLPHVLVPIPDSRCLVGELTVPRTVPLATAVAKYSQNAVVSDVLRWKKSRKPSHTGGSRDPQALYDNLILTDSSTQGTYVLVDDMFTRGGHVLAAAARICAPPFRCRHAVCLGRAVFERQDRPFAVVEHYLHDFFPSQWYIGDRKTGMSDFEIKVA
jgi:hypothetical protein